MLVDKATIRLNSMGSQKAPLRDKYVSHNLPPSSVCSNALGTYLVLAHFKSHFYFISTYKRILKYFDQIS